MGFFYNKKLTKMKKKKKKVYDFMKIMKKCLREEELENEKGFTSKHKVHKSKKTYNKKNYKVKDLYI